MSHYLAGSSRCYRRAVEEVRTTFDSTEEIKLGPKLNSCVYLRACVDETLRITPPGGGPLLREVEQGGASIDGQFVPEGCHVAIGMYAISHAPTNWEEPFRFIPERWLDKSTGAAEQRQAYIPFNVGPRSCVGKPLAIGQIMLTLARILWEFDFRRPINGVESLDGDLEPVEYKLVDYVSGQNKGPVLQFQPRF